MTAPAVAPTPQTDTKRQPDSIKATDPGTEYVILEASSNGSGGWLQVGKSIARDADAAILKHSEKHDNQAGKFVAIPTKRWNPKTITPETVTTLKLEEAK